MTHRVRAVLCAAGCMGALLTGFGGNPARAAGPIRQHKTVQSHLNLHTEMSQNAVITATADARAAGSNQGSTTISWNTGDGSFGQLYVSQNGGTKQIMAQGATGSVSISWIAAGSTYAFMLFDGTSGITKLATVDVTLGSSATAYLAVTPDPVPAGSSTTNLSWDTGGSGIGQVLVSANGSSPALFAQGDSGQASAPWIMSGAAYTFSLAVGSTTLLSQTVAVGSGTPGVSASPASVPAGPSGSTTITWDTGDGSVGQVYVSVNGGGKVLFAQGPSGSAPISWIYPGNSYVFTLYDGTTQSTQLGSVTVSMATASPTLTANPNPVSSNGATTISWNTGDGSNAQVWVAVNGGGKVLFAQGPSGSAPITWISAGNTYVFKLYAGTAQSTVLASVSVSQSASSTCSGTTDQCYLLNLINQSRAAYNLAPLQLDLTDSDSSTCGAYLHSYDMAQTDSLWHYTPSNYPQYDNETFPTGICGYSVNNAYRQNVGYYGPSSVTTALQQIHNSMMSETPNTPSACAPFEAGGGDNHACNILSSNSAHVGLGIYTDPSGIVWVTEDFESN